MDNIKQKLKEQAKQIGWRAITTVILTLVAVATVWVYASFVEPAVGPNDAGWDQDFLQNILGANNDDNDFDSSSVVLNKDGSIIERLEYVQGQGSTTPTCGNGVLEAGEGCDDAGTSWTSGACAGDCTRRNYWSDPSVANTFLGTAAGAQNRYCQEHGYNKSVSAINTNYLTSTWNSNPCTYYGAIYSMFSVNAEGGGWFTSMYNPAVGCTYSCPVYIDKTTEIWCTD